MKHPKKIPGDNSQRKSKQFEKNPGKQSLYKKSEEPLPLPFTEEWYAQQDRVRLDCIQKLQTPDGRSFQEIRSAMFYLGYVCQKGDAEYLVPYLSSEHQDELVPEAFHNLARMDDGWGVIQLLLVGMFTKDKANNNMVYPESVREEAIAILAGRAARSKYYRDTLLDIAEGKEPYEVDVSLRASVWRALAQLLEFRLSETDSLHLDEPDEEEGKAITEFIKMELACHDFSDEEL